MSARRSTGCPAPAPGSCMRPCRARCRPPSSPAPSPASAMPARARRARAALARPKSSTFTASSGRDLDVRRLQIAVDDALLVRGVERGGDLAGDMLQRTQSEALFGGARRSRSLERVTLDDLHHQRENAVDRSRSRGSWRRSGGSASREGALRARSARSGRDRRRAPRAASSARRRGRGAVARAIHLAHAADAEQAENLVLSDPTARLKRHRVAFVIRGRGKP